MSSPGTSSWTTNRSRKPASRSRRQRSSSCSWLCTKSTLFFPGYSSRSCSLEADALATTGKGRSSGRGSGAHPGSSARVKSWTTVRGVGHADVAAHRVEPALVGDLVECVEVDEREQVELVELGPPLREQPAPPVGVGEQQHRHLARALAAAPQQLLDVVVLARRGAEEVVVDDGRVGDRPGGLAGDDRRAHRERLVERPGEGVHADVAAEHHHLERRGGGGARHRVGCSWVGGGGHGTGGEGGGRVRAGARAGPADRRAHATDGRRWLRGRGSAATGGAARPRAGPQVERRGPRAGAARCVDRRPPG